MTQTHVLIVDRRQQTADQIARLLGFESDLRVVGHAATLEEALPIIESSEAEVILLGSLAEHRGIDAAARILVVEPVLQVILLAAEPTTDLMREALKAGLADVVKTPPDSTTLYESVRRAGEKHRRLAAQTLPPAPEPEPASNGPRGTIVAVHSGKGGAGCTTLATNLAIKLHSQEKPAVLVDADFAHCDVPLFLNLQPRHTVADLLPFSERADPDLIHQVLLSHESGLRVLAAPGPLEEVEIPPAEFLRVLDDLRTLYGWVVVDTGELLVEPALPVLQEADLILSLLTPDIPAIRQARTFFEALHMIGIPDDRVALVLNMAERGGITAAQIEGNLGREIAAEIEYDRKAVLESINRGEPLALNARTKPFTKGLLELVSKVRVLGASAKLDIEPRGD